MGLVLKICDFVDPARIFPCNKYRRVMCLVLKIGDFGDQSDQARILSLNKINLDLNTYPGLKIGVFRDHSANNTNEIITRGRSSP